MVLPWGAKKPDFPKRNIKRRRKFAVKAKVWPVHLSDIGDVGVGGFSRNLELMLAPTVEDVEPSIYSASQVECVSSCSST